ncbi:MCP four helix bundle domain-containing protein [Pontibacter akesuensis]|uniref:Four helix bundle sensory module for signal transduction n=1 Tax=Pontibacter akesuensis TaxID=388950 RepID=A0A1I7FYW2_9BACT|nr:MCP four helix bundle domain-containing protein [Pontibacter akesuensis]GHA59824.1 hypothetical protein GCM10007389_09860 [Pontibacter akesuensis]SFU41378.1 Four helix bundle sensory module for signal transduction [Pontibacter akesuensis]
MSWSFRIKQRKKIALALGSIFLIIVLANWFVSYSMTVVSTQFKSVYADRLVPALDISAIQEYNYQNRLLLEEHILAEVPQKEEITAKISENEHRIDSLVAKYSATYLTPQESEDLKVYLQADQQLGGVMTAILKLSAAGDELAAGKLYKQQGLEAFQEVLLPLHALSLLQEEVGQSLYEDAERQMKSLKILSNLVIALAVILALMVGTLLQTSRKIKQINPQKFHLN